MLTEEGDGLDQRIRMDLEELYEKTKGKLEGLNTTLETIVY